ncbi:winged helix-turn-helix transcriptional regulator [Streptomyces sp. NPDC047841]
MDRTIYPAVPLHVEYALTDLGRSVAQPLAQLRNWVEDHVDEIA